MRIAIIGAGAMGSALSTAAVKAGHHVTITATSEDKAKQVAAQTGATPAASNTDAATGAEIVVLAVPGSVAGSVLTELAPVLRGKVVIDATNPLNATFSDLDIEETAAVQSLQRLVPDVPVIKALNTLFSGRLSTPDERDLRLDGFYAGDDANAKQVVADLLTSLGFRPIDAGGLRMARALEEMAFLNIALNAGNSWSWQSGWALVGPTA
ncbi:MAG TPA: NADPH-dependent F420 reductase [Pseudonocardiaceae bacterium]